VRIGCVKNSILNNSYGLMATGRFDNVALGGLTPLGPWPEPGPRIYIKGFGRND
jgi:hypothetical protein